MEMPLNLWFSNLFLNWLCMSLALEIWSWVLTQSDQILYYFSGEPIDERGPIPTEHFSAIHAEAPDFVEMSVEQEILVTGIKVVDLLAPYSKGGKIGKYIYFLEPC